LIEVETTLRKILAIELDALAQQIKRELEAQGHKLTGSLLRSVDFRIEAKGTELEGVVEFLEYGRYVNTGVAAANIPFQKGSGRKSSRYIDALIDYWRKRGLGEKESKRAAFATATKHSREGMPTRSSKRFSSTGRRTGAVNIAIDKRQPNIEKALDQGIEKYVIARVEMPLADLQKYV